ncbi:MAG: B12-binding domain-containing radical SAM protein [Bacillota bacterium]
MKLILVNIYPGDTIARYLLSSYVLKAYTDKFYEGHNVVSMQVLNFSINTPVSRICDQILKHAPDAVGYSCYVWNIERVFEVIRGLRGGLQPVQILGGPEITVKRISSMGDPALGDFFVIGGGERKLVNLIRYLLDKQNGVTSDVPPGVAYWNQDGTTLCYVEDKSAVPLKDIPSVYLQGTLDDYLYEGGQVFLETQRGCRYRCKYCTYHKGLPSIDYFPLERVLREIGYLIIEKRVSALRICDAVFTSDLNRAKAIVEHLGNLKREGIKLPWIYWEFGYKDVDEEFLKMTASLKERETIKNCDSVEPLDRPQIYSDLLLDYTVVNCVGVQSFNEKTLKAVGRAPVRKDAFDKFMNAARRYNVVLKIDLILGLPFETLDSYFEGLEFFLPYFRDTDHILNIHRLQILPGTELEELCDVYEISYSLSAPHLVFSTNGMSRADIARASKITAVLFRILNSPLRKYLYDARERSGSNYAAVLGKVLEGFAASPAGQKSRLILEHSVDDIYWNDEVFFDIPTSWLRNFLARI